MITRSSFMRKPDRNQLFQWEDYMNRCQVPISKSDVSYSTVINNRAMKNI